MACQKKLNPVEIMFSEVKQQLSRDQLPFIPFSMIWRHLHKDEPPLMKLKRLDIEEAQKETLLVFIGTKNFMVKINGNIEFLGLGSLLKLDPARVQNPLPAFLITFTLTTNNNVKQFSISMSDHALLKLNGPREFEIYKTRQLLTQNIILLSQHTDENGTYYKTIRPINQTENIKLQDFGNFFIKTKSGLIVPVKDNSMLL